MEKKKAAAICMLLAAALSLSSCSIGAKRTPEEWLSLSYAGLAGMDQYAFSGSMSILGEGGVEFKPHTFEGKIVSHKQLTIQANSQTQLYWNPVQVLGTLRQSNEQITIIGEDKDPVTSVPTITLQIDEQNAIAKRRWSERLEQQLNELESKAPIGDGRYRNEWLNELKRSRQELDDMLSTLQVSTQYELIIDKRRQLPLKMEEQSTFNYERNGRAVSEARHTIIRFQDFDGAARESVH